ncbi:MAG: hypothetical protein AAFO07_32920 [Bacteroidota bacterium]
MEKRDLILGEFIPVQDVESIFGLIDVKLKKKGMVEFIVLNPKGVTKLNDSFKLEAGKHQIKLDLSTLKPGTYNAWISLENQTFLRTIVISQKPKKRSWKTLFYL